MAVARCLAHLIALTACLLAAAALTATPPARGQDRTPKPSADELWQDYPLDQGEPAPAPSAAPTPGRGVSRTARPDDAGSGDMIVVVVLVVAALAAATVAVLLVRRHRRSPHEAGMALAPASAAPRLAVAGPPASANGMLFSTAGNGPPPTRARREPARPGAGVRPPNPERAWKAEIGWQHSGGESRFRVVARHRRGGGATTIARSEPLEWPPQDADSVQALVNAVDALAEALTIAGWKPLPPGTAWFEKRFEWVPAPASTDWAPPQPTLTRAPADPAPPPAPVDPATPPVFVDPTPPPAKRFSRSAEWPAGSQRLWRCEIRWRSGYVRSRFEAVMREPGGGDRVIATSAPFKWLLMGDPDQSSAAFRDAVRALATALEAAGWERVGAGVPWYAVRFVWRGDGPPPDDVEAPANAHRAS